MLSELIYSHCILETDCVSILPSEAEQEIKKNTLLGLFVDLFMHHYSTEGSNRVIFLYPVFPKMEIQPTAKA